MLFSAIFHHLKKGLTLCLPKPGRDSWKNSAKKEKMASMDTDAVTTADDVCNISYGVVVSLCILLNVPNSQKRNVLNLYTCTKRMTWTSITEKREALISLIAKTRARGSHTYMVKIGSKRIRWFPPRIPEHPSVLISKDTARNKACQTIDVRQGHIPEAYMEPCEYILTTGKKYKRTITWIDLTNVHTNDKYTQTTNKVTMTENHKINAEPDRNTYMFSSFQLLDYDEGHKPSTTEQTHP